MAIHVQEASAAPTVARTPIESYLGRLHARYAELREGGVADYIPELASADADAFGIAIATTEGSIYEVGDTRQRFTIQSISKPLTYALVLDALGDHEVHRRIGVEPTGDAFNSITLHPETGSPLNAMVNAGAIAAAGLVGRADPDPMGRLIEAYGHFAGRTLSVDERVYRSERETGHRNRAIANLLRGSGVLDEEPDHAVDRYFRQCAIELDTRDLAVIAATLAAGGTNPLTGVVAATPRTVRTVLAVMASCGMYDGAGEWFVGVGLPAKSGVSGGILAVLPGRLGIAVWSPPLDVRGNSVRGVAVCRDLSISMDLHPFTGVRSAPIRSIGTVAVRRSKRVRPADEQARLGSDGEGSHLLELQSEVGFAAVEAVVRAIGTPMAPGRVVLDLGRVSRLDPATAPLLADLASSLHDGEATGLAWSDAHAHAATLDAVDRLLETADEPTPMRFPEMDAAIEWCEERILAAHPVVRRPVDLADHPVLARLTGEELAVVASALTVRRWSSGERVVRRGDPADELYLLTSGELSVYVPLEGRDAGRRLATLTAGMVLGEVSFLGGGTRTANVLADSDGEAWILDTRAFATIRTAHPVIAAALLENLYRILAGIAKRLTDEVASIAA